MFSIASSLFSSRMSNIPKSSGMKCSKNKGTPPKVPKGTSKSGGQSASKEGSSHPRFEFAYKKWSKSQAEEVSEVLPEAKTMDENDVSAQSHVPTPKCVQGRGLQTYPWILLDRPPSPRIRMSRGFQLFLKCLKLST